MSVAPPAQVQHARLGSAQPLARIEAAREPIPQNWPARPRALILVCGGRDYTDSAHVHSVLDALQPRAVVHGACGVDAFRLRQPFRSICCERAALLPEPLAHREWDRSHRPVLYKHNV